MARPPTIQSEDLLEATRAVVLEKGLLATTADIAERAGVSEGTLFKRFGSKDALFREALRPSLEMPDVIATLPSLVGKGDLIDTLTTVARQLITDFSIVMPLMILGHQNDVPRTGGADEPGPM